MRHSPPLLKFHLTLSCFAYVYLSLMAVARFILDLLNFWFIILWPLTMPVACPTGVPRLVTVTILNVPFIPVST